MPETFYQVLDVDPEASGEEIESAYREKVKETHPDVSDDPDAEDRFKTVQRAKEVLTDPDERARYDRLGHREYLNSHATPDPGSGPTTGPAGRRSNGSAGTTTGGSGGTTTDRTAGSTGTGSSGSGGTGDASGSPGTDTGTGTGETANANTTTDGTAGRESGRRADRAGGAWDVSDARSQHWERDERHPGSQRGSGGDSEGSAYATRNTFREQTYDSVRVPLTPRTIIQIVALFVLYPILLGAALFPGFPTIINVFIAVCTLVIIGYLVSIPEVAMVVFGAWSLLTPAILVAARDLQIVSLPGIVALVACWFPFGLALLMRSAVRS